jgi:hypothetical protein
MLVNQLKNGCAESVLNQSHELPYAEREHGHSLNCPQACLGHHKVIQMQRGFKVTRLLHLQAIIFQLIFFGMAGVIKKRCSNFSSDERNFILQFIGQNKAIQDKRCDVTVNKAKKEAWSTLSRNLQENFSTSELRTPKKLMDWWRQQKCQARS